MTREIADLVPRDCAGAREIGFAIPERYNASRILFDNLAKGFGDRSALVGPAGTRSYKELCADASRWGHGLQSLGLKRGDRVLLFLDDTPAYPAAFFGAVRAGFVPLLINTLTPPDLLQFYLADSGASVAIADAEFAIGQRVRVLPRACLGGRRKPSISPQPAARSPGPWSCMPQITQPDPAGIQVLAANKTLLPRFTYAIFFLRIQSRRVPNLNCP